MGKSVFLIFGVLGSLSIAFANSNQKLKLQETVSQVETIISENCANCHSEAFGPPKGGLNLEEDNFLANMVNVDSKQRNAKAAGMKRVKPNDAENSLLYLKITHNQGDFGKAMPPMGGEMMDEDIAIIKAWIMAGAPLSGDFSTASVQNKFNKNGQGFIPEFDGSTQIRYTSPLKGSKGSSLNIKGQK